MRKLDVLAAVLVIVGGLNWGLVAIAEFDLVATLVGLEFGETNALSRIVYGLVGLAALYQIAQQSAIRQRWSRTAIRPPRSTTERNIRMSKLLTAVLLASGAALAYRAGNHRRTRPARAGREEHRRDRRRGRRLHDAGRARRAGRPRRRPLGRRQADRLRADRRGVQQGAGGDAGEAGPQAAKLLRACSSTTSSRGDLKAADIVERRSVRTLAGAKIKIRVRDGNVRLNRSAKVVQADVAASNGTIHVIDRVLLPPRNR